MWYVRRGRLPASPSDAGFARRWPLRRSPAASCQSGTVLVNGYTDADGWEVTGLDWRTGETVQRVIFGHDNLGNGAYAIIQFAPNGDLIFNSVGGPFRHISNRGSLNFEITFVPPATLRSHRARPSGEPPRLDALVWLRCGRRWRRDQWARRRLMAKAPPMRRSPLARMVVIPPKAFHLALSSG